MAKAKPDWEQNMMKSKWAFFIMAAIFLAIAYGFASLAINYGSFWQYALAALFLIWAVKEVKRGIHNLRA